MINKKTNKKAITFYIMLTIAMILLCGFFYLKNTIPKEKIINNLDTKQTIIKTSSLKAKLPAEELYINEAVKLTLEQSKESFTKELGLSTKEYIDRLESDPQNLLGCKINDLALWYNQKNIDYNINQITSLKKDTKTENEQEDTKTNQKTSKNKYDTCLPNFTQNFNEKIELYFKNNIEKVIQEGLLSQGYEQTPQVELTFNPQTQTIKTKIKTFYKDASLTSKITQNKEYEIDYNLGSFPQLLQTMQNIIPQTSDLIKSKVPTCIKDGNQDEIGCIKDTIITQIKTENSQLLDKYNFDIQFIDTTDTNYYALQFKITNKNTNTQELNFGIILKDNIPYSLINFDIEQFNSLDNTVNVVIDRPKFYKDVSSYVILYSYANFFNENYNGYNELLKLLEENKIPSNFEQTGYTDIQNNQYFYPSLKSTFDVSLITTSDTTTFEQNAQTNKYTKKIKLYQIYNKETRKYEKLQNRPLYVYAFATDKSFNYYVNDIKDKTKTIIPQTIYGPTPPIANKDITISPSTQGYQNTLFIKIENYTNPLFNNYDIYITPATTNTITQSCKEITNCYYYNGKNTLTKSNNIAFIISSDIEEEKDANLYRFINSKDFTNNLILQNGNSYNVYIIPVDTKGNGIITPVKQTSSWDLEEEIVATNENLKSYYKLIQTETSNSKEPALFKSLKITDSKAPDLTDSINIKSVTLENGVFYLNWEKTQNSDVSQLKVDIIKEYSTRPSQTITTQSITQEKGRLISNEDDLIKITINRIIPIDESGNVASTLTKEPLSISYNI